MLWNSGSKRSVPLSFSPAERSDQRLLRSFECAQPVKRRYDPVLKEKRHDAPWELEVQSGIRRMSSVVEPNELLMLGKNERGGLEAVGYSGAYCGNRVPHHNIFAIAVQTLSRGHGYAAEVLDQMLQNTCADPACPGTFVARIHPENDPSMRLFGGAGFEMSDEFDGVYNVWFYDRLVLEQASAEIDVASPAIEVM